MQLSLQFLQELIHFTKRFFLTEWIPTIIKIKPFLNTSCAATNKILITRIHICIFPTILYVPWLNVLFWRVVHLFQAAERNHNPPRTLLYINLLAAGIWTRVAWCATIELHSLLPNSFKFCLPRSLR